MPEATDRLNAALDGRYRIERQLGAGGMARGAACRTAKFLEVSDVLVKAGCRRRQY